MSDELIPRRHVSWSRRAFAVVGALGLLGVMVYQGAHEARLARPVLNRGVAPEFSGEQYGGGTVSLAQLRGQVVMLDFWATWCPACVEEMPSLVRLAREYQNRGFSFVAADQINSDSRAAVGVFLAQHVPPLSDNVHVLFADDSVLGHYQIHVLPTLFLIGRDGRVLSSASGFASEASIRARIEAALAAPRGN